MRRGAQWASDTQNDTPLPLPPSSLQTGMKVNMDAGKGVVTILGPDHE